MILPLDKPQPRNVGIQPHLRRIEKPWGWEDVWAEGGPYTGKVIHVLAGHRLSLQYHDEKLETQFLLTGDAIIVLEDRDGVIHEVPMERGKGYTIRPFQLHRIVAREDSDILEVSTPETGTTVRVEDDYGRPDETDAHRARVQVPN